MTEPPPPPTSPAPPALVLAAGAGSRLGTPKPLAVLRSRTLLEHAVAGLRAGGAGSVHVVVGSRADLVAGAARAALANVVRCDEWALGRTRSVQAGLTALAAAEAVLLAPVDVPLFRRQTVRALLAAPADCDVVVPVHAAAERPARGGHPVLLRAAAFESVLALGPDAPLRDALRTLRRCDVPVDDPGVLVDVNSPEDLERARALVAEAATDG